MEAGHIVLTGSFTPVAFAEKGDTFHADFGASGGIGLQFT
jgi:2-oxo-hept-3-ene-1,7-dioate hydratase